MDDDRSRIEQQSLGELLDDPIIALVMRRDGVDRGSIERLIETLARRRPAEPNARERTTWSNC